MLNPRGGYLASAPLLAVAFGFLGTVLLVGSTPAASTVALDGALASKAGIQIAGSHTATAEDGTIHTHDVGKALSLDVQADVAVLNYTARSGDAVGSRPGEPDVIGTEGPSRQQTHRLEDARLTATGGGDPLQLLATLDATESRMTIESLGEVRHTPDTPAYLTRVGDSPDGASQSSSPHGFWYNPPADVSFGSGADTATLTGNLTLFVNNATVTVDGANGERWENWTGYQEEDVAGPAKKWEQRILFVHLTNATLELSAPNEIDFLAASFDVDADGAITSDAVEGQLVADADRFLFDEAPIHLDGAGSLTLDKRVAPAGPQEDVLLLDVGQDARFDVQGGQRLAPGTPPEPLGASVGGAWIGTTVAFLLAGAAVAYRAGALDPIITSLRSRSYSKWMTRGRELASGRDFEEAAKCFRRAKNAEPEKGFAWYHLALSTLEAGDPRATLDVIDEIRSRDVVVDPLDLLELEISAAQMTGDTERCRRALEELADGSEWMASSLIVDLDLDEEMLGPELAERFASDEADEGSLQGYA